MPKRMRWLWLAAALAVGCGRPVPTRPQGTGAEAAARDFCEAVVRQDWDRAHALLDADAQAACSPGRFGQLAATYRAGMGFEPDAAHVRSCEEHGDDAVAHVVFSRSVGSKRRSFQDGLTLHRGASGWAVRPPPWLRAGR